MAKRGMRVVICNEMLVYVVYMVYGLYCCIHFADQVETFSAGVGRYGDGVDNASDNGVHTIRVEKWIWVLHT